MNTQVISTRKLSSPAGLHLDPDFTNSLDENSSAIHAMTDLRKTKAVTIEKSIKIDDAHQVMINRAIRLLFVVDSMNKLVGLITARDILGERPTKIAFTEKKKHQDISVEEIMTKTGDLVCIDLSVVEEAKIRDLLPIFRNLNFQHLLVASHQETSDEDQIIGIISTSQIAKILNASLDTLKLPSSLYDIQKELS